MRMVVVFVCELIIMCRESLAEDQLVEISCHLRGAQLVLHGSLFPANLFNIHMPKEEFCPINFRVLQ